MKKLLIAVAFASLIFMQSCSNSKETNSSLQTVAESKEQYPSRRLTPVIDGKINDWPDTMMSYDAATKSIYSIANDESNLYICIKAPDQMQQIKMIQGGMEIWVDDKMKRNKKTGVKFPVGGGNMEMPGNRSSQPDPKEMRQQLKLKMLNMELTGFKIIYNGKQSVYSSAQVKPVMDWDDKDNLIYELAIPFATLDSTMASNLSNMSIGIVIKALKMPEGMGGGPGGGMPGAGMQPPSGMRRPGGNQPDRSGMENMTKENYFWTKYTIAKQ